MSICNCDCSYELSDLQSECRGLRTDVDNLLAELQRQQQELTALRSDQVAA